MSNFHRIVWIDEEIRMKRYPNNKIIAQRFEISIRQAARDIEYMRYSMGAPIEYSAKMRGYYYADETYLLPANFITSKDKKILSYLAHQYSSVGHGMAGELAGLFSRLSGDWGNNPLLKGEISVFDVSYREVEIFQILKKALSEFLKVEMIYLNSKGERSKRIFCPYKLFIKDGLNYVVGFCELKEEVRVFRLSRIKDLILTDRSFQIVSYFDEKDYGSDNPFEFFKPYTAVIKLKKLKATGNLKHHFKPIGDDTYEVKFYQSQKLLSELLTTFQDFTIVSPIWLKEKLINRLKKIIANHFDRIF